MYISPLMVADCLQVKLVKASNLPREARNFVAMNDPSCSCIFSDSPRTSIC